MYPTFSGYVVSGPRFCGARKVLTTEPLEPSVILGCDPRRRGKDVDIKYRDVLIPANTFMSMPIPSGRSFMTIGVGTQREDGEKGIGRREPCLFTQ